MDSATKTSKKQRKFIYFFNTLSGNFCLHISSTIFEYSRTLGLLIRSEVDGTEENPIISNHKKETLYDLDIFLKNLSDYNLNRNDLQYTYLIKKTNIFRDEIIFAISDLYINFRIDMDLKVLDSYHLFSYYDLVSKTELKKSELFIFLMASEYFRFELSNKFSIEFNTNIMSKGIIIINYCNNLSLYKLSVNLKYEHNGEQFFKHNKKTNHCILVNPKDPNTFKPYKDKSSEYYFDDYMEGILLKNPWFKFILDKFNIYWNMYLDVLKDKANDDIPIISKKRMEWLSFDRDAVIVSSD